MKPKRCHDCKRVLTKGLMSKHGRMYDGAPLCKWCQIRRWRDFINSIDPDDEP